MIGRTGVRGSAREVGRSEPMTARFVQIPKLTVRVLFPSPACLTAWRDRRSRLAEGGFSLTVDGSDGREDGLDRSRRMGHHRYVRSRDFGDCRARPLRHAALRGGGMTRSSVPTTAQLGIVFHAAVSVGDVRERLPEVGRSAAHFRQAGKAASGAVACTLRARSSGKTLLPGVFSADGARSAADAAVP